MIGITIEKRHVFLFSLFLLMIMGIVSASYSDSNNSHTALYTDNVRALTGNSITFLNPVVSTAANFAGNRWGPQDIANCDNGVCTCGEGTFLTGVYVGPNKLLDTAYCNRL